MFNFSIFQIFNIYIIFQRNNILICFLPPLININNINKYLLIVLTYLYCYVIFLRYKYLLKEIIQKRNAYP